MEQILALRPFIPARDHAHAQAFYQALGFARTHADPHIAILKQGSFSFILQNHYVREHAENTMFQMLVRNVDQWWADHVDTDALVAKFGVKPPKPPAMQEWGLKVGFIFDPSGVLLHVAEAPF